MTRWSVCRGCGKRFPVKPGSAGQYCERACYTNPLRRDRPSVRRLVTPISVEWDEDAEKPFDTARPDGRRASVSIMSDRRSYFWSVGWGLKNGPCGTRRTFSAAEAVAIRFMATGAAPKR